jgi:hypothetical protein
VQRDTSPPSAPLLLYIRDASGSRNKLGIAWCNGRRILLRHEARYEVQIVTPYRVSHLQRYGVTARGNVTSVYPPLDVQHAQNVTYVHFYLLVMGY